MISTSVAVSRASTPSDWIDSVGFLGAATLVLFFQLNATVAIVGLSLAVLAFLGRPKQRLSILAGDPVFHLWLAVLCYVSISTVLGAREFPETATEQWKSLSLWFGSMLFIPAAFFLGRRPLEMQRVFLLFATGVLIRILTHLHLGDIASGERIGFGLNPIATALYSGLTVLGLLTLLPRLLPPRDAPGWRKTVVYLALSITLLIFLEAVMLSQSRGAWLAAAVALPATLLARYGRRLRATRWRSPKILVITALLLSAAAIFAFNNADIVMKRMPADTAAVEHAVRGDKVDESEQSIGFRLLLWQVGLQKWLERPLAGWGAGSTELLIQQSGVPMLMRKPGQALFSHLHNSYLEVLVRFGVIGAGLFGGLAALLVLAPWRSYRAGLLPFDFLCLLLGAWGMTALWAVFDFRFFHYEWRNFCIVLGAMSYSQAIMLKRREDSR